MSSAPCPRVVRVVHVMHLPCVPVSIREVQENETQGGGREADLRGGREDIADVRMPFQAAKGKHTVCSSSLHVAFRVGLESEELTEEVVVEEVAAESIELLESINSRAGGLSSTLGEGMGR